MKAEAEVIIWIARSRSITNEGYIEKYGRKRARRCRKYVAILTCVKTFGER